MQAQPDIAPRCEYFESIAWTLMGLPVILLMLLMVLLIALGLGVVGVVLMSPFILLLGGKAYFMFGAVLASREPILVLTATDLAQRQGFGNQWVRVKWQDIDSIAQTHRYPARPYDYYLRIHVRVSPRSSPAHTPELMWIDLERLRGEVYTIQQTIMRHWQSHRDAQTN